MKIPGIFKKKVISKSTLQDIIFISGILAFSAALVLGLFPGTEIQVGTDKEFFIYLMMIMPVTAAIYFIFISFSRKIYSKNSDFSSSIIYKMMLAFLSVAILPSLAIIIISNNIIKETISDLITDETVYALEESINLSNDYMYSFYREIEGELNSLEYSLKKRRVSIRTENDRKLLAEECKLKEIQCVFYKINTYQNTLSTIKLLNINKNMDVTVNPASAYSGLLPDGLLSDGSTFYSGVTKFFQNIDFYNGKKISRISIDNNSLLLGHLLYDGYLIAIIREIPSKIFNRITVYKDSLARYNNREFLKPYFQTGVGLLLLFIAIFIVLISVSVSFFLSRSITRSVLQLADAAGDVASGNYKITLERKSSDEIAHLFQSFNTMVRQLDERKQLIYHTQRLEAWKEVARRLVHEIKNPLTPIRLSAERIQNRYYENHPDFQNILSTGTETIIEEVKVLNRILNEFSGFARLPEIKPEFQSINPIIENSANFFLGHEEITFHLDLDNSIPGLNVDKILIRQALTNLLQNSIDAMSNHGNIYIKSEIMELNKGKIVRVSIKDDGPGIEPEDIEKIFDPAFSKKETGTGLGLAIVEKIILEHNGWIYCHSEKNNGAEFIIEFPVLENNILTDNQVS
ncbi:MAG: HAMP domain-containing protein [Spirochaetes bacterium]|nr:HAMP domain-containing protein [Spirochaetota bacterium]